MRLLLLIYFSVSSFIIPFSAVHAEDSQLQIQTKMDSNLKVILESLVSAVIGRLPSVSKNSKFVLLDETDIQQGLITGTLDIKIKPGADQEVVSSVARLDMKMTPEQAEKIMFDVTTRGILSSAELIQAIVHWNQALCVVANSATCVGVLINIDEEQLGQQKKSTLVLERFKANIISYLAAISSTSAAKSKKTMSFGGGAVAPSVSSDSKDDDGSFKMTPELAEKLNVVVQSGFQISSSGGETSLVIDTQQLKDLGSEFSKSLPALALISSFSSLELRVNDSETTYFMNVQTSIPAKTLATYDAYLSGEQNGWFGLGSLAELVSKIGPWAAGRCSNSEHLAYCMDKLLNSCAKSTTAVTLCVTAAQTIQLSRDAKSGMGAVGDAIGGIFGGNATKPETED
jgi:hypothetical protein